MEKHAKAVLLCLGNVRCGQRTSRQHQRQGSAALTVQDRRLRVHLFPGSWVTFHGPAGDCPFMGLSPLNEHRTENKTDSVNN